MSGSDISGNTSVWVGHDQDASAQLVPGGSPAALEINRAPVTEQSHELVLTPEPLKRLRISPEGDEG